MFQLGWPQAEPVVVFSRQHHIAGPGVAADGRDRVHIGGGRAGVEARNEVVIGGVGAVSVALMTPGRTAFKTAAVEVPLSIGIVPQHRRRTGFFEQLLDIGHLGRPAWHRIQPPVQEDPEFGIVVPLRKGMGCDGFPRGVVHPRRVRRQWQMQSVQMQSVQMQEVRRKHPERHESQPDQERQPTGQKAGTNQPGYHGRRGEHDAYLEPG